MIGLLCTGSQRVKPLSKLVDVLVEDFADELVESLADVLINAIADELVEGL